MAWRSSSGGGGGGREGRRRWWKLNAVAIAPKRKQQKLKRCGRCNSSPPCRRSSGHASSRARSSTTCAVRRSVNAPKRLRLIRSTKLRMKSVPTEKTQHSAARLLSALVSLLAARRELSAPTRPHRADRHAGSRRRYRSLHWAAAPRRSHRTCVAVLSTASWALLFTWGQPRHQNPPDDGGNPREGLLLTLEDSTDGRDARGPAAARKQVGARSE